MLAWFCGYKNNNNRWERRWFQTYRSKHIKTNGETSKTRNEAQRNPASLLKPKRTHIFQLQL